MFATILIAQFSPAFAQSEAKGLLIYQEPGTSSGEAIEYRSFHKDNALYSTLITPNGQSKQIKMAGVAGLIDFPPLSFDDSLPELERRTVAQIQSLERQFPPLQRELSTVRGKWERALSVYEQTHRTETVSASPKIPVLVSKTAKYEHAHLIAATCDLATIGHDAGVARIPLTELDARQIIELNGTSRTVQVGTPALEADRSAPEGPLTNRLRKGGLRVLALIQERTGLRADVVSTWLLFAIFPVLILALLIINLVHGRKARPSGPPSRPRPIRPTR